MPWYHGGDLQNGKPKGPYLYVTDSLKFARAHAKQDKTDKVYRLLTEFDHLIVTNHHDDPPEGFPQKVIRQLDMSQNGGALAVFEEVAAD